jgi:DNA-binding beta-propeller fold protein YncE
MQPVMRRAATLALMILPAFSSARAQEALDLEGGWRTYPHVDVASGYRVDSRWPSRTGELAWGEMPGVCVDAHDQVWTFNRGETPVQVYDNAGRLVRAWGQGQVGKAHSVRIDPAGFVWLSDIGLHVVRKFTPEGELLLTLGTPGEPGEDSTHLNMPTDLVVTPAGDIFVTDGYGNNRVVHFDASGTFVKGWGRLGSRAGEFSLPHSIAVDSVGRLYVADRNNARVQVFDQSGRYLDEWRDLIVPWQVVVTPKDEVYVCGSTPMRWPGKLALVPGLTLGIPPKDQVLMRFDTTGRARGLWAFPMGTDRPGELSWVHGLGVDSKGNVYLGDVQGHRVQKFVPMPSEVPPGDGARPAEYADRPRTDPSVRPASAGAP